MRVLFAVFILSLLALVVVLMALRRHIRNHGANPGRPLDLAGTQQEDSLKVND